MKKVKKLFFGIDWGTHSSKWVVDIVFNKKRNIVKSGLIRSDLLFHNKEITISPSDYYTPRKKEAKPLKGLISNYPFGTFWKAGKKELEDIGMSLGMGVVFSICSLFGDSMRELKNQKLTFDRTTNIEIGFSFPNWMWDNDDESRVAVNNYHQAIYVACYLFELYRNKLPIPSKPYNISKWKALVDECLKKCTSLHDMDIQISEMTAHEYKLGEVRKKNQLTWKYLFESCAAGLPYLRNIDIQGPRGLPELGKLLVIDVGAGSTDIGYMIRTLNRTTRKENLFYFTPAQTLNVAGNDLTKKIQDSFKTSGKPITFNEAENFKITNAPKWIGKSFARQWRRKIMKYVKEYITNIPDKRWIDSEQAPLQTIITGGSGLVEGLEQEINIGVSDGLKQRGLSNAVARDVIFIDKVLSGWQFAKKEEYARKAVAIGSSDRDKPSLKYREKMDPPTPRLSYTRIHKYKK